MKIIKDVILSLNKILTQNLISINQYFLHARILKNFGMKYLNDTIYARSIKVMRETDQLIERILLLEGLPNLQNLGKLFIGEHVKEILKCDLIVESDKNVILKESIFLLEEKKDYVSRDLLVSHKTSNEEYIDWIETQFQLIKNMTLENYIQFASHNN